MLPWANTTTNVINKLAFKNPRLAGDKRPAVRTTSSITLSEEQLQVIRFVIQDGLNVFYTGSAGTGKSVLLRELVKQAITKFGKNSVAVTASTGLAAVNIGGQTINRFASIGLGKGNVNELYSSVAKSRGIEKWKKTKILIIDEISMIDGNLFTKLNALAKKIMKKDKPFGGIQVVLTGDFFQLPPVPDRNGPATQFCFKSEAWNEVVNKTILLTKVFRQKGDTELIDILNALRIGDISQDMVAKFRSLARRVRYDDGIQPTELFPTRMEVERANKQRLESLPGKNFIFDAKDTGPQNYMYMLDSVMAVKSLTLREDAQVMMLKNKDEAIVNGSVGRVLYFLTSNLWTEIKNNIHEFELDTEDTIQELRLLSKFIGEGGYDNEMNQRIQSLDSSRKSRFMHLVKVASLESTAEILPVVKFSIADGGSRMELIEKEDFFVDVKGGSTTTLTRTQLPLLLSWALSIHKAQGQTLDRVKVDLNKVFENGQVYVALSRAVSKDRLEIVGFDHRKIKCSPEVKKFYASLETFNS